jgi:FSR family fosmidomycin resistance protein-like MFS transporter
MHWRQVRTLGVSTTPHPAAAPSSRAKTRNLFAACVAHALHDGYTDGLYAFLPIWQTQFGLTYASLGVIRALYYGTMGALQVPADRVLRQTSPRAALVLSTLIASAGFLIMALPGGFAGLCVGLVLAGVGSSAQHPRASMLVNETYGADSRGPLGIYNFSGDLGKAALPALAAVLLPILSWRPILALMAILGIVTAFGLMCLASMATILPDRNEKFIPHRACSGFSLLTVIGALDTATRMGYLLFLPFLIQERGGSAATVGVALALLFIGGAFGKATCARLGQFLGVVGGVATIEAATALLITATLFTPLSSTLVILPCLGVVLNGTSSLLYGTVPELAPRGDIGRAFAIFYTGVIGSGGVSPVIYGAVADHSSRTVGILAAAATSALIIPLIFLLRRSLSDPLR